MAPMPNASGSLRFASLALIAISLGVVFYFTTQVAPPEPAATKSAPIRDDVTLRRTDAGDVVGFVGNHGARTWLAIPFAAPPVGRLRWQPPRPARPWTGVHEALTPAPQCPQVAANSGSGAPAIVARPSTPLRLSGISSPKMS